MTVLAIQRMPRALPAPRQNRIYRNELSHSPVRASRTSAKERNFTAWSVLLGRWNISLVTGFRIWAFHEGVTMSPECK